MSGDRLRAERTRFASNIHKTSTNKLLVIDLTKTGAVDALPLCGLIEAAVKMFIEINLQEEGPMIINTDLITFIEYNEVLGLYEINLNLVAGISTEKDEDESEEEKLWKKFHYSIIHLFPEEYETFRKKLLAENEK